MSIFKSQILTTTENFAKNRREMLALVEKTGQLEERAAQVLAKAKPRFNKRGHLLPSERVARLWRSC